MHWHHQLVYFVNISDIENSVAHNWKWFRRSEMQQTSLDKVMHLGKSHQTLHCTGYIGALGTLGAVSKVVLLVLVLVLHQSHYHRHITHQTESVAMGLFTCLAHTMCTRTVKGTGILYQYTGVLTQQQ